MAHSELFIGCICKKTWSIKKTRSSEIYNICDYISFTLGKKQSIENLKSRKSRTKRRWREEKGATRILERKRKERRRKKCRREGGICAGKLEGS